MIRSSLLASLSFAILAISSQAQEAKIHFDTGDPPWGGERIVLPPGFAPDMKWIGIEDIRFAPGMFKADSDSFFSYALVFLLEKDAEITPEAIHREVLTYYKGLSKAVMKGKEKEVDTSEFKLHLKKEDSPTSTPAGIEAVTQFAGTLDWIEPFATQCAQKLHLEIQLWDQGGQPALFFCVSPKPRSDESELWKTLRGIRSKFRIESPSGGN